MSGIELDDLPEGPCTAWAFPNEIPDRDLALHQSDMWCVFLGMATDIVWAATGRRWRNVESAETVTFDEKPEVCGCAPGWPDWRGSLGMWSGPSSPVWVLLPRPDVTGINSVLVDGQPVAAWRRNANWLVRTDGRGWPMRTGRTRVNYSFGRKPPPGGRLAVVTLAVELGKAGAGQKCALPSGVTSVTRQGVTYQMSNTEDLIELLTKGATGLVTVDQWVISVNRHLRPRSGQVISLDTYEGRPV